MADSAKRAAYKEQLLRKALALLSHRYIAKDRIEIKNQVLGRGGFGDVKLGILDANCIVAVKELRATGTTAENIRTATALAREARTWAKVIHPHVVQLIGFHLSESFDLAWLISPYMKHGCIREYLQKTNPDELTRLRLLFETADGLSYLHRLNICHGDVKGRNVLIDEKCQAKLCDFGLAKALEGEPSGLTASKVDGGSLRYIGPELQHDWNRRSFLTDVWAWGCLGLEILVGMIPYQHIKEDVTVILKCIQGEFPADLFPLKIPERIKDLMYMCWETNPQERPPMAFCADEVLYHVRALTAATEISSESRYHAKYQLSLNSGLEKLYLKAPKPPSVGLPRILPQQELDSAKSQELLSMVESPQSVPLLLQPDEEPSPNVQVPAFRNILLAPRVRFLSLKEEGYYSNPGSIDLDYHDADPFENAPSDFLPPPDTTTGELSVSPSDFNFKTPTSLFRPLASDDESSNGDPNSPVTPFGTSSETRSGSALRGEKQDSAVPAPVIPALSLTTPRPNRMAGVGTYALGDGSARGPEKKPVEPRKAPIVAVEEVTDDEEPPQTRVRDILR